MLRREIMDRKKAMTQSAMYIIYFGIATRILLFVKEIFTASRIGITYKMDSYLLALGAIMLIATIIGDAIIVAIIPLLHEIEENEGKERTVDYTNNLINSTMILSLILIVVGYIAAPIIMKIYGPGFRGVELKKAIELFRLGLPMMSLVWIRSIGGGYLQADHAFKAGAKGGVANAIIYIIYLIFFAKKFGLEGLMLVGSLAIISQIYIVLKTMKGKGFKYKWKVDFQDKYLKMIVVYLLPILLGIGINEVNLVVDNAIASTLRLGAIAELNYANQVIQLFLGLFVTAIVTVSFPALAEDYKKETCYIDGECSDLNTVFTDGIKIILTLALPVSIILMTMAEAIIKIVFERGAFGAGASFFTSEVLVYYAIGLSSMAITPLIIRGYYAIHDMRTPISIAGIALVFNIGLDLILIQFMGLKGLALGTSISSILAVSYGMYDLNRIIRFTEDKPIKDTLLRIAVSGLMMALGIILASGLVSGLMEPCFLNNLISVTVSSVIGVIIYSSVYKALKIIP